MGVYLKQFENHTWYDNYINGSNIILPNVSLCVQENEVHFNPYVHETRLVTKYNVTSTSDPTALRTNHENNIFKSMEIDGVMLDELVTEYTFDTIGVHTVKYELYDETKLGNQAPVFYNSNLVNCIIPDSVTSIGDNTFNNCSGLTSIDIPDSVTSIGNYAFQNCSGLTSVTIPNSVTSIGGNTFSNTNALKILNYNAKCELNASFRGSWDKLETVIIGDSTSSIGNSALSGCTSLTSVTIGNSVTSINGNAFNGCNDLTSINVNSGNTVYDSRDNCNAIIETSTNTLIRGCKNTVIPNSVTSIGSGAFNGCSGLTSVTIGNSVTSISIGAFNGCNDLTSINVNSGNTVYDSRDNCNAIIETSTNTLIRGCKNTVIPNSVTSISSSAFNCCSGLTSVTIGNNVTSIGYAAFVSCTDLTSVTIGNSVTSIGGNAFMNCSGLTSIDIPDSVTSIGNYAFQNCSGLISCTIGSGVASIGSGAFSSCNGLISIVSNAMTAPTITNNTFRSIKTDGTLTVLSGSTGYDVWMGTSNYYLGLYNWTKVEQ